MLCLLMSVLDYILIENCISFVTLDLSVGTCLQV